MSTRFRADCPICGSKLMKAAPASNIELDCPKCKSQLQIVVSETGYQMTLLNTGIPADAKTRRPPAYTG